MTENKTPQEDPAAERNREGTPAKVVHAAGALTFAPPRLAGNATHVGPAEADEQEPR